MKRLACVLIFSFGSTLLAQQQISFTAPSPKVGQTYVRTLNYKMNADVILKFAGETLEEHNNVTTSTIKKSETVLATKGDAVTKLKVTYQTIDEKTVITEDGVPINRPQDKSPVLGNTYVVESQNGSVKVTDASGLKPSEKELEIVKEDYEGLGNPDGYLEFFRQKTVQVGEPLQMPGIVAEGIFRDAEHRQVKVDRATFALKSVRNNVAVFDTGLKMQWNQDENTSLKMNVTGETLIGIQNSRMLSSTMSGTLRMTGVEQLYNRIVMVDGKGTITMSHSMQMK